MRPHTGLRGLAARRPLTTYVVLGISLAYLLTGIWALAYHGILPGSRLHEVFGIAPDEFAGLLIVASLFPTLRYVVWAGEGRAGVVRLFRRMLRWRVHPGWWITVLVGLPALTVGLAALMGDPLRPVELVPTFLTQLGLLAVNLVLVNIWEEAAWSGFFQSRLERRRNIFLAAVISAIPFAVVHLPLQFFTGGAVSPIALLVALLFYFVLGVIVRPMLATILRGTGDSILLVALAHSVFNRTNNDNGIGAALLDGEMREITMLIAVAVLTVVLAILFRRRLTKEYRRRLDAANGDPVEAGDAGASAPLVSVRA